MWLLKNAMELIPNRLYFFLESEWNEDEDRISDMIINLDELYEHSKVHKHFGPPSIKMIWKHCDEVDMRLQRCRRLIFLTNDLNDNLHIERRTMSAFLMTSYAVLRLEWDAEKANSVLLQSMPARLAFFRDYHGDSSYKLNILDCMRGLVTGCQQHKWFTSYSSTKFPQATNTRLDMNWVVPGLFLAFKDPTIKREKEARGISKAVLRELKRCSVKVIVRLNGNDHVTNMEYYGFSYNSIEFKQEKFFHYDIPFKDVNIPTIAQANQFVTLCERYGGKVAVHCHAGLGRTATMIGCHLIKNYGFGSRSVCGWLKMCRRGSVMGPQHFFLDKYARNVTVEKNICQKTEATKVVAPVNTDIPSTLPQTRSRISRTPRKNNIIHIVPVGKTRTTSQVNRMHKYTVESTSDVADTKRTKLMRSRQSSRILTTEGTKKVLRPSVVTPNPTPVPEADYQCKARSKSRVQTTTNTTKTKPRKPNIKKSITNYRAVSAKIYEAKLPKSKTRTPTRPATIKHATKSHDTLGPNIRSVSQARMIGGSSSWSQWGERMIEGLITNSRTKLNGLIGNMYHKDTTSKEFMV